MTPPPPTFNPKTDAELARCLANPVWRLHNIYTVLDAKSGQRVPFVPSDEQAEIIALIHIHGLKKLIILKARQLGMSTLLELLLLDFMLWTAGVTVQLVDATAEDAHRKLREKVRDTFAAMPEAIQGKFEILKNNEGEFSVKLAGAGHDAASTFYAGAKARGGTTQALHISEWGPIQHLDPKRSEEIRTGALPAAKHGLEIIETTWMGGKVGDLWDLVKVAIETPENRKLATDRRVLFFPWWRDKSYRLAGSLEWMPPEMVAYFAKLAGQGIQLDDAQKLWYWKTAYEGQGIFRFREYPSTLEECFQAPVEGAIYAEHIDALRVQGRILDYPVDGSALVHTAWDLGSPANTSVWYFQMVGPSREIRVIDHEEGLDLDVVSRVSHMLGKGYRYGCHFLPHDGAQTARNGRTIAQELEAAGLANVKIVPRTTNVWIGVNRARQMLPRCLFHAKRTAYGVGCLESYHTGTNARTGARTDEPVHDASSHAADAFRTIAEAELANMIPGEASQVLREVLPRAKGGMRIRIR